MATVSQQPPVALNPVSPALAALGTSRGQGSVQNQQHGCTALGIPQGNTQSSSTQPIDAAAAESGVRLSYHYASFYKRLANTVTNVALISIGLVIAGIYGKIAERQGNESLKATLWRDCIDLPDTVGTTETCKKLLATGFDSLSKRSIQIQQHGVPSLVALFWEELFALKQLYVVPSLVWTSAFGLDVFGRIMVNTISLMILFGTHTVRTAAMDTLTAAMDTDQSVWSAQRRRVFPKLKVWRRWLDFFSFVVGHMVGYLFWAGRDADWPRRNPWVFVTQALHFDITVCLISLIMPGNILQKLSADHTSGALDRRTAGFIALLASVASLSWTYYNAFHFISPNAVDQWQIASREVLSTWLVVTITTVVITLALLETPVVRRGLRYIIFEYMAFIFSILESIPYVGAIFCDLAGKFRRRARRHLFDFQHAD